MTDSREQDQQSNDGKRVRALLKDVAAAAHCDVSLVSRKRARGKSDAQIIREGVMRWKRQQKQAAGAEARQVEAEAIREMEQPVDDAALEAKAAGGLQSLTYDEAQRLKEIELYRRQKLANDESEGKLVDGEAVKVAWSEVISTSRSMLLLIPDEIGDRLASESDPIRCRELVREKIHHALSELATQAA